MIRKRFRKQKEFSSHAISVLTMLKACRMDGHDICQGGGLVNG